MENRQKTSIRQRSKLAIINKLFNFIGSIIKVCKNHLNNTAFFLCTIKHNEIYNIRPPPKLRARPQVTNF